MLLTSILEVASWRNHSKCPCPAPDTMSFILSGVQYPSFWPAITIRRGESDMRKTKNSCRSRGLVALCLLMIFFLCSCADLVVENIHSAPFTGPTRIIKATVKNKGSKAAPASTTSVQKASNPAGPYTQVATVATPPLNSGEEKELMLIPDPANCIHLKVCADINNDVYEGWLGDEGNNCTMKSIGCP